MTHLELSNLMTDYVEGALGAAQVRQVEEHLESCDACRALVDDVRFALSVCRDAADIDPSPLLMQRILRATVGERKPSLKEELAVWLRPIFRPQIAYSLSMAIFSLSFILYAANVKLRSMSVQDANPVQWVYRANSRGHMLFARAEKYYYDLRFVYEVQSILHDLRQEPAAQPEAPKKMRAPGGSSSDESPSAGAVVAWEQAPHEMTRVAANSDHRSD